MQTPASRALAAGTRRGRAARSDGALLTAIACVLAAILLYAVCVAVWGPGDDDELLEAAAHPSCELTLVRAVVAARGA